MKVNNTNDLSVFVSSLKDWATKHSYEAIVFAIDSAEKTSFTASELIIKYAETLRVLKDRLPSTLPNAFRDNWDDAIRVGLEGVETVEYEEKDRSIFSIGW